MKKIALAGLIAMGLTAVTFATVLVIPENLAAQAEEFLARTVFPPLPKVPYPKDEVELTDKQLLGKKILFDTTLSDPPGYACAQCHAPSTGFSTGLSSEVNLGAGPQPGVVPGRSGARAPQSYAYATFSPIGPVFNSKVAGAFVGGAFWDGRVPDLAKQARQPFVAGNEMANRSNNGIYPGHAGGYSGLVVKKVKDRPYADLFKKVFGEDAFKENSTRKLYSQITIAIAAFEASGEINQFSSKYDASKFGVPKSDKYVLSPSEERGRALFFGKATCSGCHSSSTFPEVLAQTDGKDTFTLYLFQNVGVPRNPKNPFYQETDCESNPHGCNPQGADFVDFGLGANPNPAPDGRVFMDKTPGDKPRFRGLFQAPTLRNVDKRPDPKFVKPYMHNGVFKSLAEVVHFYNKRNIAIDAKGKEVVFDLRDGPPAGATRLLPPPEVMDNVVNVAGNAKPAEIGNLGLTDAQEHDIVAFLGTLTDGFTKPNPPNP